tara:strand:+ start:322 stop:663 length:342 start_codon:yes stop_codon:yes gene_type:complete
MAYDNGSKMLIFIDAGDDAAMYPVQSLLAVTVAGDGQVLMKFKSSIGGRTGAEHDSVALTCTADTELVVFKAIADAINKPGIAGNDGHVVVCDDVNSVFLHANILSCLITLDT